MASLVRALQRLRISTPSSLTSITPVVSNNKQLLPTYNPLYYVTNQSTGFFNKLPATHLWKSATSVSNAGAKKGRGKGAGKIKAIDLNRGQFIGVGKTNIIWPGLNSPVIRGNELVKRQTLPEDPEREAKILKLRDSVKSFRFLKIHPFERGWCGNKWPGRRMGPPDPIGEYLFEGFDTICLEYKALLTMKSQLGRARKMSALCVTGNGKGLAGFAVGKCKEGPAALKLAKNRAAQKLIFLETCNNTVYHNFFTQFAKTKIFVWPKPEGYGLKCHRVIKAICRIVGIKNLHAKVEGPTNTQAIVKAFFIGLMRQNTHQEIANRKKLHLVEFCKESHFYPNVLASPNTEVRKPEEIEAHEILDYEQYNFKGRLVLEKQKWPPFYTKLRSWKRCLRILEKRRNHNRIKIDAITEYGQLQSFLNVAYPEEVVPEEKEGE